MLLEMADLLRLLFYLEIKTFFIFSTELTNRVIEVIESRWKSREQWFLVSVKSNRKSMSY